jgi:possible phosphoglucomutase
LEDGSSIIVRPSGTEPKIKAYYTTLGKNKEEAKAVKEKYVKAVAPIFA